LPATTLGGVDVPERHDGELAVLRAQDASLHGVIGPSACTTSAVAEIVPVMLRWALVIAADRPVGRGS
jgi:hypothetical protein